jgi:hypothetical protein
VYHVSFRRDDDDTWLLSVDAGHASAVSVQQKASGQRGPFHIAYANYAAEAGKSGGAVLRWTGSEWHLLGIHLGADSKRFNDSSAQQPRRKRARSAPPVSSDTGSSSRRASESTNSIPSAGSDAPAVDLTEVAEALAAAQTNQARTYFVLVHDVLRREHWMPGNVLRPQVQHSQTPLPQRAQALQQGGFGEERDCSPPPSRRRTGERKHSRRVTPSFTCHALYMYD